mmetsp:Transcript_11648/g.19925  ORF Transcript_11648/g.19925 Transcript_11648/m.19925 type:complete len:661 (-) Transcript_11648:763-2745(-)
MNNLDDRIAAKRKVKRKTKSKKKRRPSLDDDDVVIGQLKSPPELLVNNNQASKFSGSSIDSSLSSKGKISKDGSSEHYDASVAKMPGAYAAKATDVSDAEQFKFGTLSTEAAPATKPGAYSASFEDLSAAERLKFGMVSTEIKPATMPGAFSASNEDLSAAERLKFGIVSNAEVTQVTQAPQRPGIYSMSNEETSAAERLKFGIAQPVHVINQQTSVAQAPKAPGAYSMSNEETSAAERLKFGIAQPVPVINNQISDFDLTAEYEQSYASNLTNDYWGTQPNQHENSDAVIEAEVVSAHDDLFTYDFDVFGKLNPKNWRTLFISCSLVSFIIIISLSAALDSAKNKNTANETTDPKQPVAPTLSPTIPPVDISWCFNSTEYVENVRYASLRSTLVASGLSTDTEFATDDSYQRKSLCWLAFGDALQIDKSDPFIEQRFALATLFYSLNEPSKLLSSGWLSGKQECAWTPMVECDVRTGSTVSKLNISGFDLQGQLPKELSSLRYVTHLDLSKNVLNGGVTRATTGWSELQELRLANNRFETAPELMDVMSSVTYFDVSANNITGEIPVFLSFASNLAYLDISSNSFSSDIPAYMGGNLPLLESLYMHSNDLTGKMPQSICNLRNVSLKNLSVDCGVAEEVGISGVSCDVPQCCSVCNGYV